MAAQKRQGRCREAAQACPQRRLGGWCKSGCVQPRHSCRKITPAFICRALAGAPVEVYGGGHQVSDMVYVGDVAQALVRALECAARGDVFTRAIECGPRDDHTTVRQVAELVIELCDSTSEIVDLPMRPGEIPNARVVADAETLHLIGMDPDDLVPLREGMTRTVEYFRGLQ